jgi:uncharacterized protein
MKLIGRQEEIAIMLNYLNSNESGFLAMYGRRRVGKTYLIRQVFEHNIVFECAGLKDEVKKIQLENFCNTLNEYSKQKNELPNSWLQAFNQLKEHILSLKSKKKKIIFLDEISWYDGARAGFLPALNNFWNQFCAKRNDIILVICGSVASWIIKKIINDKGGLHNRISQSILLKPFTLQETKHYLALKNVTLSQKDLAQLYMTIGGIPYYLNFVKKGKSIALILNDLFFNEQAALATEFEKLYAALFSNHVLYITLIKTLASKHYGMRREEIIAKSNLSSGNGISTALIELEQCGFIECLNPIKNLNVDKIYRLLDEFSLFYCNFLSKKSTKIDGPKLESSQKFKIWSGYAFENLCIRHQANIAKKLGINGIVYDVFSWTSKGDKYNKGAQIDLIFDRSDNCINLFEIKFNSKPFLITKEYATQLINKKETFIEKTKTKKSIFTTLITANGSVVNEHHLSSITNELTIVDLFQ